MIEMIKLMAKTAAPAYMSLTAVSTGAGARRRSGPRQGREAGRAGHISLASAPAAAGTVRP